MGELTRLYLIGEMKDLKMFFSTWRLSSQKKRQLRVNQLELEYSIAQRTLESAFTFWKENTKELRLDRQLGTKARVFYFQLLKKRYLLVMMKERAKRVQLDRKFVTAELFSNTRLLKLGTDAWINFMIDMGDLKDICSILFYFLVVVC